MNPSSQLTIGRTALLQFIVIFHESKSTVKCSRKTWRARSKMNKSLTVKSFEISCSGSQWGWLRQSLSRCQRRKPPKLDGICKLRKEWTRTESGCLPVWWQHLLPRGKGHPTGSRIARVVWWDIRPISWYTWNCTCEWLCQKETESWPWRRRSASCSR